MLHPSVTYGDTVFKGMLATGKHDIERFAALCNTLGGEALGCGGGIGAEGSGREGRKIKCGRGQKGLLFCWELC